MLIIDAHLDLAWNALQWNRNLQHSVYTIRVQEGQLADRDTYTVAYPELRRGRVALSFVTLLARSTGLPVPHLDFLSPFQCYGIAQGQLAYYRGLAGDGQVRLITGLKSLNRHIAEWQAWEAAETVDTTPPPPPGFVLSMEGADPILHPEQLQEWWQAGLRLLGLTHFGLSRYGGGTGVEEGLTEAGRALLAQMERLNILLDLTHCSDATFWEALTLYSGPVLASHSNCRALVPNQRQFSDEQLKAIIKREGVIGTAFDVWMLEPGWTVGQRQQERPSMAAVVDHIDHVCQLAGNSRHAAIGSDLDGGFGREQSPCGLDTIADVQQVAVLLAGRGYSQADVEAIMYGNWLGLLRRSWQDGRLGLTPPDSAGGQQFPV